MPAGCTASGSCSTWSSHPATSPAGCSNVGPASTSHLARPGRLPDMGAGTQTALERVDRLDWSALTQEVDAYGHAQTVQLLTPAECVSISALYDDVERFGPPSTWAGTDSGRASTATSTTRCRTS